MLALADTVAVVIAVLSLGTVFSSGLDTAFWAGVFVPVWIVLAKVHGLYDRDQRTLRHLTVDEIPAIASWAVTGTGMTALLLVATPVGALTLGDAFRICAVSAVAAFFLRASARFLWRRITPRDRTLIVGHGPVADATRRKLELFPDIHVRLVDERADLEPDELAEANWAPDLDRIILASQTIDERLIAEVVGYCRRERIKLSVVPPARGMFGTAVRLSHVADLPFVEYSTWDVPRSTLLLKRMLDVGLSGFVLFVFLPLFLLIALAIKLDSRGPVFFVQRRAGRHGRPFRMRKFRTMVADAEEQLAELVPFDKLRDPMFKLRRDPRVTRVGRVLRRTSLDELPQLMNVVAGDMSLVGPRPEQIELVDRYGPEHHFRLAVKPGITGPMQVFGRGELSFEERLAVERDYIENLSVGRDLRLLAMTIVPVIKGRGAF
jgi:exopolysaccharide biosynthesis polyprenyl glycosylphosphotransferase